jgi:hypothetical protein
LRWRSGCWMWLIYWLEPTDIAAKACRHSREDGNPQKVGTQIA